VLLCSLGIGQSIQYCYVHLIQDLTTDTQGMTHS
jgi:hypothetical protein